MLIECSERPEKVVEPSETEVIEGYEPPYGFQELNLVSFAKATNALIHRAIS